MDAVGICACVCYVITLSGRLMNAFNLNFHPMVLVLCILSLLCCRLMNSEYFIPFYAVG